MAFCLSTDCAVGLDQRKEREREFAVGQLQSQRTIWKLACSPLGGLGRGTPYSPDWRLSRKGQFEIRLEGFKINATVATRIPQPECLSATVSPGPPKLPAAAGIAVPLVTAADDDVSGPQALPEGRSEEGGERMGW